MTFISPIKADFYGYFQHRWRELPVWLGIPCLGAAIGGGFSQKLRLMIFVAAVVLAMAHVLLINDWGDLKKNPFEKERFPNVANIEIFRLGLLVFAIFSFIVSFCLGATLVPVGLLLFFAVTGATLSLLYSHPGIHLKESIWGSTLVHLGGGVVQFMLGYSVFSGHWQKGFLLGAFFSLIFVAGHLVHECIDIEEDKKGGIQTRATRFGARRILQAAVISFLVAHLYLGVISFFRITHWDANLIFFPPLIIHLVLLNTLRLNPVPANNDIKKYRACYRLAYACCALVFIVFSINKIQIW